MSTCIYKSWSGKNDSLVDDVPRMSVAGLMGGVAGHANCLEEVDRAIDNLVKSGKLFPVPRRDSMPMMMGRHYPDYGTSAPLQSRPIGP